MNLRHPLWTLLLVGLAACTHPGVDASRTADLQADLDGWRGKPFTEFEKTTGWKGTQRTGPAGATFRVIEFNALGAVGEANTLTYHQVTPWSNEGQPGPAMTQGPNQPVNLPSGNATVRTETITIPQSRTGCRLFVWVDAKGLISSWRMEGGECFRETLNRLKRP
jgi:hypothetical protein